MRRVVGLMTVVVVATLASCGGDGTLPFGASPTSGPPASVPVGESTTAATLGPTTEPDASQPSTSELPATASSPVATSVAAASTTTAAGVTSTTAAAATTVPMTSPVGPTTSTSVLGPNDPPALFVDVGATAGQGAAPPIEAVVTELRPGAIVLPAGARVLDVEIRVLPSADPDQTGASARNDRIRSIVGTDLPLEQLTARFRDRLQTLGAYQPSETPQAAPLVGVTITAAPPAATPTLPAWTIVIVADADQSGRWVIDVQRQDPAFAAPPTAIPPSITAPLAATSSVLDALEWRVDGWSFRRLVDDADGEELVSRRLMFVSGTPDINEVAGALMMSLPGAQRTDLDGTVEILAADGARWDVGGTDAAGLVRGVVQLDG